MRVLVTGGHGFVGSHLVRRLVAVGDAVRCVVRSGRPPAALEGLPVEVVAGDLDAPATLERVCDGMDEVYHLAARLTARARREMQRTNVVGTRALLAAARRAGGVRRFVHCSSLAAAGPSAPGVPRVEGRDGRPVTWYGASKAAAEREVEAAAAAGLPTTVVRPPVVYGPRDRGLLSVFQAASRGLLPLLGAQPKVYSWVFGDDLAEALLVLGRHPATVGRTYYAAHDEVVSMETFLEVAVRAAGRRGRRLRVPDSLLRLAAGAADLVAQATGRPAMLTRDKTHELVAPAWVCSSARAAEEAGWSARTPVAAGVPATMRWYRDAGWL